MTPGERQQETWDFRAFADSPGRSAEIAPLPRSAGSEATANRAYEGRMGCSVAMWGRWRYCWA